MERLFWAEVAQGLTSEEAAVAVGASEAAGRRWFRERGGMPTFLSLPLKGRYLSFEEREEIAIARAQGQGVRAIAAGWVASRPRSPESCGVTRRPRGGKLEYRASVAQWKAELVARRPKVTALR